MSKNHTLLKNLIKTRAVLKEKLKKIKLNELDRVNLLEDTFQPITNPLKHIIGQLNDKNDSVNKNLSYGDNDDDDDKDLQSSIENVSYDNNDDEQSFKKKNGKEFIYNDDDFKYDDDNFSDIDLNYVTNDNLSVDGSINSIPINNNNEYNKNLKRTKSSKDYVESNKIYIKKQRLNKNIKNKNKRYDLNEKFHQTVTSRTVPLNLSQNVIQSLSNTDINVDGKRKRKNSMQLSSNKRFKGIEKSLKRKSNSELSNAPKRKRVDRNLKRKNDSFNNEDEYFDYKKRRKTTHLFSKRKSETQLNNDKKRLKLNNNDFNGNMDKSSPASLFKNVQLLISNKKLDRIYGFNEDAEGKWRYGKEKLIFSNGLTTRIGDMEFKMTPGLFELVFHTKPIHYSKNDLQKYKKILIHTSAHKRRYQPEAQIKGTKAFKYQRIIKKLFNTKTNVLTKGSGLSLKSFINKKPNYIYWDDPNELVNRLRLLLSSEGVGHNNHKNEIISIIEELRESNVIY